MARASRFKSPSGAEFSLSVSRALEILSTFSLQHREQGLIEISRSVSLSKGSVGRFLQALEMHGYVDRDPESRLYRPGPEVARVGALYRASDSLREVAIPIMRDLVRNVGFTSYLSERSGDRMIILIALEGPGPIKYSIPVGAMLPLHSTATGQVALAHLPKADVHAVIERTGLESHTANTMTTRAALLKRLTAARALGYSVNWEEHNLGVGSVAAPVNAGDGKLLCVLSSGFATSQVKKDQVTALGRAVVLAAKRLAIALSKKGVVRVG